MATEINLRPKFSLRLASILFYALLAFLMSCTTQRVSRELTAVESIKTLNPKSQYLKVHMRNGDLYILHQWAVTEQTRIIQGFGDHLDINRKVIGTSGKALSASASNKTFDPPIAIPFDEIVIVETNKTGSNPGVATMVITSLFTFPLAIACIVNPKGCFGSCPTFYVASDTLPKLVAEGFSSSITRSMEETDVDLIDMPMKPGPVQITMMNEALETHLVKEVNLLIGKKQDSGNRILQSIDGPFFEINHTITPKQALYNNVSVLDKIALKDNLEWYSLADSLNLNTKEDIYLEFDNPGKEMGLILTKRQSLMTTYLFYQSMALAGNATAHVISEMETRKPIIKNRMTRMYDILGGIDVSIMNDKGHWQPAGSVREAGPIVADVHLVRLPQVKSSTIQIRLRMTKGLWRINMANIATIEQEVFLQRLKPETVTALWHENNLALAQLLNPEEYLVTFPGEDYRITYPVNYSPDHEYFIESTGYYIEWMREEWLQEENLKAMRKALISPSGYLKRVTPYYKKQEAEMEEIFWNSKYTRHEN